MNSATDRKQIISTGYLKDFYQDNLNLKLKPYYMRYLFTGFSFVSIFLTACDKDKLETVPPEVPVEKTVTYTVYAEKDYSSNYYLDAKGQLELTVAKISENGTKTEILWDTVFAWRKLADFPEFQNRAKKPCAVRVRCQNENRARKNRSRRFLLRFR